MKFFTGILVLTLAFDLSAQDKVVGQYRDYFGSQIDLKGDKSFKYTFSFDMSGSWTKGIWTMSGDTVELQMIPTYDTLSQPNLTGIASDSLVLSGDEKAERITQAEFIATILSSGGQNRMKYPDKLLFRKGRLYTIRNGKLVTGKQIGIWTNKKYNPWFFKEDQ